MRIAITIPILLSFATTIAHAHTFDAKALARYDISYVKCEAHYPAMQGHRDDAYLSLWRIKPGKKSLAELAAIRKGATYQSAKKRAVQDAAKATSASASTALDQQCQGLWAEYQRAPKSKR